MRPPDKVLRQLVRPGLVLLSFRTETLRIRDIAEEPRNCQKCKNVKAQFSASWYGKASYRSPLRAETWLPESISWVYCPACLIRYIISQSAESLPFTPHRGEYHLNQREYRALGALKPQAKKFTEAAWNKIRARDKYPEKEGPLEDTGV